jgi:hypothetical protein
MSQLVYKTNIRCFNLRVYDLPFNDYALNPTLSITPSKPSVSSGSLFTLVNCKIYYLSHVNYDPTAADLISIRVTIYLWPVGGKGWDWEAGRYGKGWRAGTGGRWAGPTCLHPPHMCNIHITCMISCFTSKPHILAI